MTHDPSVVDSILLEWICAIEGYKSDYSRIEYIYPLFCGRRNSVTGEVGSVFDCEELKQIPDIIPQATLSAAKELLTKNKVFRVAPPGFATKTVKSIVTDIREFKGLSVNDDKQKNFLTICAENLIKILDNHLSKMIEKKVRIVYLIVVVIITIYNTCIYCMIHRLVCLL